MPLYDWKCHNWACGHEFEDRASMGETRLLCPVCGWTADRQFSPNKNILIPGHFKMDRGWHLPPEGSSGSDPSLNSRVHAPKRTTFKEQFDKAYRG